MSKVLSWRRSIFLRRANSRFYGASQGLQASRVVGDCLRPYLLPDDIVLFDSTLDPINGELVAVRMAYRRSPSTLGAGVLYRYELAIKQLVAIGNEYYLACATGAVRAERHELIGPVVAWSRRGWRRASMKELNFGDAVQHAP